MFFSDEEEKKLITVVSKHPVIYDTAHANYRNNAAKDHVWQAIGEKLNKNSDDCKKKWKFIRDGYNRFKKKHHLGTGSTAPKHSKDKRHKLLSFLDNIPKLHRSGGWNIPSSPEVLEYFGKIVDGDPELSSEEQEKSKYAVAWSEQNTDYNQITEIELTNEFVNATETQEETKIGLKRPMKRKNDDIDLFCRHLAKVLRNLPPVEKAKAKKHLNSVLSDYEIMSAKLSSERHYSSSSSSSSSSS